MRRQYIIPTILLAAWGVSPALPAQHLAPVQNAGHLPLSSPQLAPVVAGGHRAPVVPASSMGPMVTSAAWAQADCPSCAVNAPYAESGNLAPIVEGASDTGWEGAPVSSEPAMGMEACPTDCSPACEPANACVGLGGCELGEAFSLSSSLFPCETAWTLGGWVSAGYHTESDDLFNAHPDRFNNHQSWIYLERAADAEAEGGDWGFRADVMYGVDAADTQAFGNPSGSWDFENGWDHGIYGWALPQLYGQLVKGDWSVKLGHFFTPVGYEVVTAPDNFFYSHAMTMYNSEPFTHTGVLATREVSENLTIHAGWTLGWDTGFDQLNRGSNFLGGFSASLSEDVTLTYITTAGNFGARGDQGYGHSIVTDFTLTDKLNYVLQSDNVRIGETGEDNVGINQYLFYTVSDCVKLGSRLEWWKGDVQTGYAPHGGVLPNSGSLSYYQYTFGVNLRPHANFVVRPEVRYDWSPAANYEETIFGIDGILTF